jgi:peptidyl-prolyl cis-trans isomerase C
MKTISSFMLTLLLAIGSVTAQAQNVLEDNGVGMSREELEQVVARWTSQMQEAAANSNGDRLELLSKALVSKKLELEARKLTPEQDAELYWKITLFIRDKLESMMVDKFVRELVVPDMTPLAKERYMVEKDKYALVPEQRISSHILVLCAGESCDRDAKKALADSVLAKVVAGEDFAELAAEYSDDTASKNSGGRFERWLKSTEPGVSPPYLKAVFDLEQAGDHSAVVVSSFGFHIIRVDEIKDSHYRDYEQVEPMIVKELTAEYTTQAARSYVRSFKISDNAVIDGAVMEEIFAKYKTAGP